MADDNDDNSWGEFETMDAVVAFDYAVAAVLRDSFPRYIWVLNIKYLNYATYTLYVVDKEPPIYGSRLHLKVTPRTQSSNVFNTNFLLK